MKLFPCLPKGINRENHVSYGAWLPLYFIYGGKMALNNSRQNEQHFENYSRIYVTMCYASSGIHDWYMVAAKWLWINYHNQWCIYNESLSYINTLGPRQNDRHFANDIFKSILFNENLSIYRLLFHLNLLLGVKLTTVQHWIRWRGADRGQAIIWINEG